MSSALRDILRAQILRGIFATSFDRAGADEFKDKWEQLDPKIKQQWLLVTQRIHNLSNHFEFKYQRESEPPE